MIVAQTTMGIRTKEFALRMRKEKQKEAEKMDKQMIEEIKEKCGDCEAWRWSHEE